jgi:hypothetical protein
MTRFALALILACSTLAAAERLPADCRWAAHLDVQRLMASSAGAWIAARLAEQPHAARLTLLEAVSGLDPRRDLRTVTIGGADADENRSLVLLRGTFDPVRLANLARAAEGHAEVRIGSRTVHTWLDKGRAVSGCLIEADLLALSRSPERIRDAIALADEPNRPAADLPMPQGWEASALVLASTQRIDDLVRDRGASAMLRGLHGVAVRFHEAGSDLVLEARAAAAGEPEAQRLVEAGRGLIALAQLQHGERIDPAVAAMLAGLRLERQGAAIQARVAMPASEALRLLAARAGR